MRTDNQMATRLATTQGPLLSRIEGKSWHEGDKWWRVPPHACPQPGTPAGAWALTKQYGLL
jgi:hypothetical protein